MSMDFVKYAAKGNELLNRLAQKLGDEDDRDHAARILRSTLHVIRDNITVEESLQLLAQLPIAIKGVYVEGWTLRETSPRVITLDDLASAVIAKDGYVADRDFNSKEEALFGIRMVLETLALYVSYGELEDIFNILPKEIKLKFHSWVRRPEASMPERF